MDKLSKRNLQSYYDKLLDNLSTNDSIQVYGFVKKISGMRLEVTGLMVPVGTICEIYLSKHELALAEVIGFTADVTYLMCIDSIQGVYPGSKVKPLSAINHVNIGTNILGRVIDATGQPIDGKGPINKGVVYPIYSKPINPLLRSRIKSALDVGICAINALFTVGKGQRLGIFAGSGVGKSVLLGMMTRYTKADIVIVGLIGERGREVKEFIEESLGHAGLEKSIVVASPADTSPLMRVNSALHAATLAEYYRDQGYDVLLIIDSLSRVAHALREISLSAGELPSTKGYTPSVFSKITQLIERSGTGINGTGSITSFYTILIEGDDTNEPIADHSRSILDGHIFLSRSLADSGHYPAIDIEKSISRVMDSVVSENAIKNAIKFKNIYSTYIRNKDIINIGMYAHGSDQRIDESIKYIHKMNQFLKQDISQRCSYEESISKLESLYNG